MVRVWVAGETSQGSAATNLKCDEHYCMGFVENLTDFPAGKEFTKSVRFHEVTVMS